MHEFKIANKCAHTYLVKLNNCGICSQLNEHICILETLKNTEVILLMRVLKGVSMESVSSSSVQTKENRNKDDHRP